MPRTTLALENAALRVVTSETSMSVIAGPGAGKTELLAQRAFIPGAKLIARVSRIFRQVPPAHALGKHGFEPGAADLYRWLNAQKTDNLIVISNFHDHVTLETQIPALPIPPDIETLKRWIHRIRQSRGIEEPRVIFVLDHDNRWRDYWIKPTAEVVEDFGLSQRAEGPPPVVSALVFDYAIHVGGIASLRDGC